MKLVSDNPLPDATLKVGLCRVSFGLFGRSDKSLKPEYGHDFVKVAG